MGDLHVDTGIKRPRSRSSTPSPTVSRTRKTGRFDILQPHLELDDSTMDQNTIQQMIHASMKNSLGPGSQAVSNTAAVTPGWEFGHGDQTIQTKSKKKHSKQSDNQQGGATGNTPASTSTNDPELGTQIANQVIDGLLPQLSGAIATAIGSVVDTLVKQAVQNATALISSTMQRQSLLLRYEQDRLEQYSRRESVRVAGIPGDNDETPEQLSQKLLDVLKECEPSVTAEDISVLHRAGPFNLRGGSRNPKRPVLCKFIARSKKEAVMKGKKKLKANEDDRFKHVYVNEDLTVLRAKLFSFARNHPNVKGATTSEGRILCWLKSGSGDNRPTLIESPDDLFKLGLDQVDYKEFGLGDYVFPSTN